MTDTDDDRERARWKRVSELFAGAVGLPAGERDRFVERVDRSDPAIAAELRTLLLAHDRASSRGFLDGPAAALDPGLLAEAADAWRAKYLGRRVGPYVIRSEIGRGGMGIVFCAEDTGLGRTVALKAVAPELARDHRMRERLRHEAQALARLSHPSIATVYALEESEGELFIASEYVRGRTLREEIARGPLPSSALIPTARAIAGALAAAHASSIIHRDLKPENVMRCDNGQVKVLDFGLATTVDSGARTLTRLTATGALLGTPAYMAPEQFRGEPASMQTDVFAYGVLLHELATGRPPGVGPQSGALPAPLGAVIQQCLRADPEERFRSGIELLAAVAGSGEFTAPAAAGSPERLRWWQFHQLAISVFHSAMLVALWFARGWFAPPWGHAIFYAALAAQTAAVTMRLHLWFTSREQPAMLGLQRARVGRAIQLLDVTFQLLLIVTAAAAARADAPAAPIYLIAGIASFLALLLIEPATTRAAFGDPPADS